MHYFILGLSGSGKSSFGEYLAAKKNGLWIELDRHYRDAVEEENLRIEWDAFLNNHNFGPLEKELEKRADEAGKTGCVVSLPGYPLLTASHAESACPGAVVAYLGGTSGQCLDSFLAREKQSGRNLDAVHWAQHSAGMFTALETPEVQSLIIPAFDQYGRRAFDEIVHDLNRLASAKSLSLNTNQIANNSTQNFLPFCMDFVTDYSNLFCVQSGLW